MPIFAATVALALIRFRTMSRRERGLFLVLPTGLALANLAVHYGVMVPTLTGSDVPTYSYFWSNYGETPIQALAGIVTHPRQVLTDVMASGFFSTVIVPHLWLPFLGWRWVLGIVPTVAIYSASANDQLRAFGIYYAISLVPFLVIGTSAGALMLTRRLVTDAGRARLVAAGVVLTGALLVGSTSHGYSLRPWSAEVGGVAGALEQLADEPVVLVQSGLYPHAGYDARIQLLTRETLNDPRHLGAAVLVAPSINAYPFNAGELASLGTLQSIRSMAGGIVVSRLSNAPAMTLRSIAD